MTLFWDRQKITPLGFDVEYNFGIYFQKGSSGAFTLASTEYYLRTADLPF